jgi:prepilin-type N-terminal cleavage/methylation domain-containing protein
MYKNGRPRLSSIRHKVSNPSSGFSFVELMITVSIFGILGLYSISAYHEKIDAHRVVRTAERLAHHLALARLEAVRQGYPVTLCPGDTSEGCATGNRWSAGWIAFVDSNQNYTLDSGERPFLAAAKSPGVTIGWRSPDRLLFKPDGSVWPNGHFRVCDFVSSNRRAVIVHLTGRARLSPQAPGNKPVQCT